MSPRLREEKRLREARLTGIKTGIPTYVPPELGELRGYKLKFYNLQDVKIGEIGSDTKESLISEIGFELMAFGCGAFEFVLDDLPSNFTPTFRTRVDIHPYFDDIPWFTGFIQTIPRKGERRPCKYAGFGFFEQLDWVLVTKSYASQEVSVVIKDIIQTFVDPPTQIIYNESKIQATTYTVQSIDFDHVSAKDAIQALADIAQGYEFGVDNSREFYFRPIDTATYYWYWVGKQFQDIEIEEDPLGIRNKLYVKSGKTQEGGSNIIGNVYNQASIDTYGLREEVITAPDILNNDDAIQWANQILSEKKDPKIKAGIKNVLFDETKTKIDSKGKIKITVFDGTEYELLIKRIQYRISSKGITADIEFY